VAKELLKTIDNDLDTTVTVESSVHKVYQNFMFYRNMINNKCGNQLGYVLLRTPTPPSCGLRKVAIYLVFSPPEAGDRKPQLRVQPLVS